MGPGWLVALGWLISAPQVAVECGWIVTGAGKAASASRGSSMLSLSSHFDSGKVSPGFSSPAGLLGDWGSAGGIGIGIGRGMG